MTLAIAITQPVYAKQKNYDGVLKGSRDMWSSAISKFSLCFIIMMSERERESGEALNTHILVYWLTFIRWLPC